MELENHYLNRSNWLRAAVLGANDGILSTASLSIGMATASITIEPVILATVAGLVAGALAMAAGEYVSVNSQLDIEKADIERERKELDAIPDKELNELAKIYEARGLDKGLAMQVAQQLTEHDALGAHMRDELGLNEVSKANPMTAAGASGLAFLIGGSLPLLVTLISPFENLVYIQYGTTIIFLALLGAVSAYTGGAPIWKAVFRVTFWGTVAMGVTAFIGRYFNVAAL